MTCIIREAVTEIILQTGDSSQERNHMDCGIVFIAFEYNQTTAFIVVTYSRRDEGSYAMKPYVRVYLRGV